MAYDLEKEANDLMIILHGAVWPGDLEPTRAALLRAYEAGMDAAYVAGFAAGSDNAPATGDDD